MDVEQTTQPATNGDYFYSLSNLLFSLAKTYIFKPTTIELVSLSCQNIDFSKRFRFLVARVRVRATMRGASQEKNYET